MKGYGFALGVSALLTMLAGPVLADDATTSAPASRAAELYRQANALYDAGKLDDAEKLYREAWSLTKSYDIASNLGAVTFDRGKYRDAAEYLSFALASFPAGGRAAERTGIESALKQAKGHVCAVKIHAGLPRAQISIDGVSIGEVAAGAEVFVEPGRHTIDVRADGFVPQQTNIEATAGSAREMRLVLAAQAASGARKELLIAGGAVTGAGIVAGAVLLGVSTSVLGEAKTQRDALVGAGGRHACEGPGAPAQCAQVQGKLENAQDMGNAGASILIGAGLVGASTLIYALVARPKSPPAVEASVLVGSERAGAVFRWRF